VVLSPACADPLYRRTVRVSLGLVTRVPFCRAEVWPGALDEIRSHGYELVALTPAPDAGPIGRVAAEIGEQPVALVLGAEGPGLSASAMAKCHRARIPMSGGVDSLNVAAATAVGLFCFTQGVGKGGA
ncbi:MAG TPA: RNA methyltransferase, partial [Acidimicrobiales bacterium]|nr:RNA methyltransferase [Acidimicrobiales bacterium]